MKKLIAKFCKWFLNEYDYNYIHSLKNTTIIKEIENITIQKLIIPDNVESVMFSNSVVNNINCDYKNHKHFYFYNSYITVI